MTVAANPARTPRTALRSTMRIRSTFVAVLAMASFAGLAACEPVPPACTLTWGSAAKTAAPMTTAPIVDARAGRQDCFDRFVIEVGASPAPGWNVRYVTQATQPGSGHVVALRGGAKIQVTAHAPTFRTLRHTPLGAADDDPQAVSRCPPSAAAPTYTSVRPGREPRPSSPVDEYGHEPAGGDGGRSPVARVAGCPRPVRWNVPERYRRWCS
jgi:hypothetical protein